MDYFPCKHVLYVLQLYAIKLSHKIQCQNQTPSFQMNRNKKKTSLMGTCAFSSRSFEIICRKCAEKYSGHCFDSIRAFYLNATWHIVQLWAEAGDSNTFNYNRLHSFWISIDTYAQLNTHLKCFHWAVDEHESTHRTASEYSLKRNLT